MDEQRFDTMTKVFVMRQTRRSLMGMVATLCGLILSGSGLQSAEAKQSHVVLCRRGKTIRVPEAAARTHLARGATRGACAKDCESERTCPTRAGTVCCLKGNDQCFTTLGLIDDGFCCPVEQVCADDGSERSCCFEGVCLSGRCICPDARAACNGRCCQSGEMCNGVVCDTA